MYNYNYVGLSVLGIKSRVAIMGSNDHFIALYYCSVHDITNKLIRIWYELETAITRVIYHVILHINNALAFAGAALIN